MYFQFSEINIKIDREEGKVTKNDMFLQEDIFTHQVQVLFWVYKQLSFY